MVENSLYPGQTTYRMRDLKDRRSPIPAKTPIGPLRRKPAILQGEGYVILAP